MSLDSPLFPELTSESLKRIAEHGTVRSYPKNAVLIHEGDQTDSFYVILNGKVKVYASDEDGKEVILNIQGAGEYFGELALIDSAPRSASVMTLEPSKLAVVSRTDFEDFLAQNPGVAIELIRALVQRVRSLTESVKSLALLDVYGRVARILLDLATEEEGELAIRQRLTHQDIANMVGASREMVSRIMKDLVNGGYIRIEDRRITIRQKLPPGW
ncbi:MAG: Crp/Fnr family transcriptional regulator [Gammaproteobacteria bacterium]